MQMSKKLSRIIAIIMLLIGIFFILFAFSHPEMSWPWSNTISYTLYLIYLIVMVVFFIAPFKKKD